MFAFLVETGFHHVSQDVLNSWPQVVLLSQPQSAAITGITGMSHRARPLNFLYGHWNLPLGVFFPLAWDPLFGARATKPLSSLSPSKSYTFLMGTFCCWPFSWYGRYYHSRIISGWKRSWISPNSGLVPRTVWYLNLTAQHVHQDYHFNDWIYGSFDYQVVLFLENKRYKMDRSKSRNVFRNMNLPAAERCLIEGTDGAVCDRGPPEGEAVLWRWKHELCIMESRLFNYKPIPHLFNMNTGF